MAKKERSELEILLDLAIQIIGFAFEEARDWVLEKFGKKRKIRFRD